MIGLVHYHLKIGGVRRVMEAQAECLATSGREFRFLVGEEPAEDFEFPYQVVNGLGYDEECPDLKAAAPDISLWHFHNPTLGKNPHLTLRIYELALRGERILMQLHDFAEDNRAENFAKLTDPELLYPVATHIHYAFINSRDCRVLRDSGLAESHSTMLGNRVTAPKNVERRARDCPLVFYPVRGIRRKNLGEAVLLAAVAQRAGISADFAIALTASDPAQRKIHDGWHNFASNLKLPIYFDVVNTSPSGFSDWMSKCTHVMTTSIAEGFGMSFLEPGLLQIPVFGRDIPEITVDFEAALDGKFYQSIDFELDAEWKEAISDILKSALHKHYAAYNRKPEFPEIADSWDFGNLPEFLQERVIRAYLDGQIDLRVGMNSLEDWLAAALKIKPNRHTPLAIEEKFGKQAYQTKLFAIYDDLLAASPTPDRIDFVKTELVLDHFVKPQKFNFLRSQL